MAWTEHLKAATLAPAGLAIPAIPNLNEKTARTEHLKAATLAPAGLRSSVRFQITRPGMPIFLLFGIAVFSDDYFFQMVPYGKKIAFQ